MQTHTNRSPAWLRWPNKLIFLSPKSKGMFQAKSHNFRISVMTSFSKNSVYFYPDISCNTVEVSRFTLPIITVQITTYLYVVFIVEKFILKFHFSKIYFDNNLMINCRKKILWHIYTKNYLWYTSTVHVIQKSSWFAHLQEEKILIWMVGMWNILLM